MFHAAGMKSRCRLVITITYRSSHIPMLMMIETKNKSGTFLRTQGTQNACTVRQLHTISI